MIFYCQPYFTIRVIIKIDFWSGQRYFCGPPVVDLISTDIEHPNEGSLYFIFW